MHQELSASATHSQISTADIANVASQADALYEARSATYPLVIKSHMYHWNVTGPHFLTVHELTKTHYTDMFAAADVIAERIRVLGKPAVINPAQVSGGRETDVSQSAEEMLRDLLSDHVRFGRNGRIRRSPGDCRSRHHAGGFP